MGYSISVPAVLVVFITEYMETHSGFRDMSLSTIRLNIQGTAAFNEVVVVRWLKSDLTCRLEMFSEGLKFRLVLLLNNEVTVRMKEES